MSSPCVIARLFGGLGNQLFIYAFSRALAERNAVPLACTYRNPLDVMASLFESQRLEMDWDSMER